jgi:lyso-ornithine lipid O-acyltransferase
MIANLRVVFAVLAVLVVTLVMLPLQLLFLATGHRFRARLPRYWHRAALWSIGIRVKAHGGIDSRRPLLVVSNHVSWLDILVLASVADVTYVAKAEVKSWPLFGSLARLQRSIFVEREQPRKTQDQADEMAERLNAGEAVVLFPEGTTSDGNRLLYFKSALFAAAGSAAEQAPGHLVHVQPVTIAYTRIQGMPMGHYHRPIAAWPGDVEMLPHLLAVIREGAIDAEVSFGEAIDVTPATNRKLVSAETERQIRNMLQDRLRGHA